MAKGNQDAGRIKIKRAYEEAEPSMDTGFWWIGCGAECEGGSQAG